MARDEIVEETRRVRDEFAKSHDSREKIVRALAQGRGGGSPSPRLRAGVLQRKTAEGSD